MKELTDKQELVLKFITGVIKDKGVPPTIREIGDEFQITAKGAYDHLKAIEKKGYLKTSKNQSRAIELLRHSAEENIEDYIPVPDRMSKKGTIFALKVVGESMIGDGINDGDIAIIQKKEVARNGEIVVALIEGEATLKTYFKDSDMVRLEPSNSKFKTIKTKKASIIGKLIGLYRFY